MKKYKIIPLIIICILTITIVKSFTYLDMVVDEYTKLLPFWQKMTSCTPYIVSIPYVNQNSPYAKELTDLSNKNKVYKIYGMENDSCHVKIQSYNCYFPMNIAEDYAKIETAYSKNKIDKIKNSSSYYASSGEADRQKITQYNQTYCKLEFYVPEGVKINK